MMVGLNVVSILFFTSIAVYTSFNFLKAQIALRASTFEQRTSVAKISLQRILLEGGDAEGSFLLRRQGLILELVAGLVLPTMVFIVAYVVMDTLNIFAVNVVYVVLLGRADSVPQRSHQRDESESLGGTKALHVRG
jgi:hypothetical protein